jgi:putative endonuclease
MRPKHPHQQTLGKYGEDLAASYLLKHGYRIVQRNFRAQHGEIDLICQRGNTLVFVEVKTRQSHAYGLPEEAVGSRKLQEIIKTAQYYLLLHPHASASLCIDVISIYIPQGEAVPVLRHIENVTE